MDSEAIDMRVNHGSTHLLCGPSNSGKTVRMANILRDKNSYIKGGENITHIAVIVLEGSVNAEDAVQTEVNASQCLAQSAQVTKKPRKTETEDDL